MNVERQYQAAMDMLTPHVAVRWMITLALFFLFGTIVVIGNGWFIVAYALAIYILNLFLAFLSPKFAPDDPLSTDINDPMSPLPSSTNDDFKPFIRRLPEFKFWHAATRAIIFSLMATITRATDLPVFWPILLFYFCVLFAITMKRQILHMIKHNYVPMDFGKKKFVKSDK